MTALFWLASDRALKPVVPRLKPGVARAWMLTARPRLARDIASRSGERVPSRHVYELS